MRQPIWIRERSAPAPPPTSLRPVLTIKGRGRKDHGGVHNLTRWSPRLLSVAQGERDPALEGVLMRYRILILVLTVWIFKR